MIYFVFSPKQDALFKKEPGRTEELFKILNELTTLNKAANAKVALRARQVLIAAAAPAYELRLNQVESIFLSAVGMYGQEICPENLQKLINSETAIYDVVQTFFYHTNNLIRTAALEVCYIYRLSVYSGVYFSSHIFHWCFI